MTTETLAGLVMLDSPEDPALNTVHVVCTGCAPTRYATLTLLYTWLSDKEREDADGEN